MNILAIIKKKYNLNMLNETDKKCELEITSI